MKILTFSTQFPFKHLLTLPTFQLSDKRHKKHTPNLDNLQDITSPKIDEHKYQTDLNPNFSRLHSKYQNQPLHLHSNQLANDYQKLSPLFQLENHPEQLKIEAVSHFAAQQQDPKKQIQNSILFMKYLGHSVPKNHCHQIIHTIQEYCRKRKNEPIIKDIIGNLTTYKKNMENQQKLFHELRNLMMKCLIYIPDNREQNVLFIQKLLQFLSISNPEYITKTSFEKQCFFENLDEKNKKTSFYYNNHSSNNIETLLSDMLDNKVPLDQPKAKPKDQATKSNLQKAFKLKNNEYKRNLIQKPLTPKKQEEIIITQKIAGDDILYKAYCQHQLNHQQTLQQNLTYAYMYGLPFNVTVQQIDEFVRYLEQVKSAKVSSYILTPYKNLLEQSVNNIVYRLPEDFNPNQNSHSKIQKLYQEANVEEVIASDLGKGSKAKKKMSKKQKNILLGDITLDNLPKNVHHAVTEALLLKIKKQSYSKFNKSSIIIKFATKADKQKVLTKQARLFGINFKKLKNVRMQEGFAKASITLKGAHWQCKSQDLVKEINNALTPIQVSIKDQQNRLLTKNYIEIQFQYLTLALDAIKLLNHRKFVNSTFKAYLTYGPCLIYNGKYIKDSGNSYEQLKKKIQESSRLYYLRYEEEDKISQ